MVFPLPGIKTEVNCSLAFILYQYFYYKTCLELKSKGFSSRFCLRWQMSLLDNLLGQPTQ